MTLDDPHRLPEDPDATDDQVDRRPDPSDPGRPPEPDMDEGTDEAAMRLPGEHVDVPDAVRTIGEP